MTRTTSNAAPLPAAQEVAATADGLLELVAENSNLGYALAAIITNVVITERRLARIRLWT
ncbi:hypothetical protein ACJ72_03378 [Emergomyces africanus]|uniref:Uncharacterized protein n=1 Tax=Emergomyces africanus TaxID=1955775 RepID=A0A1B7NZR9_9EURO|nr:hypothetical protein ACJ72_03378 [Emergomyces africanus]